MRMRELIVLNMGGIFFYREDQSETADSIMQQTKEGLLKGLGDDDLQCRYVLQIF